MCSKVNNIHHAIVSLQLIYECVDLLQMNFWRSKQNIFNPLTDGGGHWMPPPPSQISSCASGIDFWVALKGWQFISVHILLGYYPSRAKNCIEKVLEYHFWGKGHFSRSMKGIFLKLQSFLRGQNWLKSWKTKNFFLLKNHIVLFVAMLRILQLKWPVLQVPTWG